jgi:hypothetical protein
MAFKVASKWQSWSSVAKVPEQVTNGSPMGDFCERRRWAKSLYERFLLGTLINVIVGALCAALASVGDDLLL